jgi:hypothetical protein
LFSTSSSLNPPNIGLFSFVEPGTHLGFCFHCLPLWRNTSPFLIHARYPFPPLLSVICSGFGNNCSQTLYLDSQNSHDPLVRCHYSSPYSAILMETTHVIWVYVVKIPLLNKHWNKFRAL